MNLLIFSFAFFLLLIGCKSTNPSSFSSSRKAVQVQGHRGSRGTHPENSIPGFEEAILAGADWIELDLVLSKDDVPMVSHDPVISVDLCLDSNKKPLARLIPVKTQTVSQLKKFDCGSVPNPIFPEQKAVQGLSLITLDELLAWVQKQPQKKIRLNIETKMTAPKKQLEPNPRKFTETVIRLLRKYKQVENSTLQSFDFRTLAEAKTMEPALKLSALFDKPGDICKTTKQLGAQVASPAFSLVTPNLIKECHELGVEVTAWTLNQESEWKTAMSLGVDGIITDYPRKLISFLHSS